MPVPQLRPSVLAAREKLADGRARLREHHDRGSPGVQLCALWTDLVDGVVIDLFEAAMTDLGETGSEGLRRSIALVPHGGYGRRDLAPFSDADLMLLCAPESGKRVHGLAERLIQDLSDAGLSPGFSVRTPSDACHRALRDATIFTSLAESRYLVGSVRLLASFGRRLRRDAKRGYRGLHRNIGVARREERIKFGETVYLLQPNIKKSRGGLRDIQLIRWIGFARFGESDLETLYRTNRISRDDWHALRDAFEFLLRIRNEMHFYANQSQDVLDRAEQIRLAELFGYEASDDSLPVERFMKDYFEHTRQVRDMAAHFMASHRPANRWLALTEPIFSHSVEGDFRVGQVHIFATGRGLEKIAGDLDQVLRLMDLANLYDKRIAHSTWVTIRETMSQSDASDLSSEAARRFLSILSQPARLGNLLRRLHQLRVLEKIVPGMKRARSLLQFNQYHKYTVDEHCLRTVERATEFAEKEGTLGRAYRKIVRKDILHLAALIHDLGKGQSEDHSEVGLRLAMETAKRLDLNEKETHALSFLVHKHLLMTHEAFQHAGTDEEVVRFAIQVGSPELLRMLFVLTCADLAAVGPGVLNEWKIEVLAELYRRTRDCLTGGAPEEEFQHRLRERRDEIRAASENSDDQDWCDEQIEALPPVYLYHAKPAQIVEELMRVHQLPAGCADAWGRYLPERKVVEYTIGVHDASTHGIFHRLTGALTSSGLEILSAEIHTLADELVLDRFCVRDNDFSSEPPPERFEAICAQLVDSIQSPSDDPPTFRRTWGISTSMATPSVELPTRILFDNEMSQTSTVIRIFTRDYRGLLYAISKTLWEADLSVSVARIGTYLDQVVDVFYVTDIQGRKIIETPTLSAIEGVLSDAIAAVALEAR